MKKQLEIETIRVRLTNETAIYRQAISQDLKLETVKPLYQRVKATMQELKMIMEEYEDMITENMASYNKKSENLKGLTDLIGVKA